MNLAERARKPETSGLRAEKRVVAGRIHPRNVRQPSFTYHHHLSRAAPVTTHASLSNITLRTAPRKPAR